MPPFESRPHDPDPDLRPIRVPLRREELFREAREMVADLDRWTLLEADEQRLALECRRAGGLLGGQVRVRIEVDGPEGIPSSTLRVRCEQRGGILRRERAVARELLRPLNRRVC